MHNLQLQDIYIYPIKSLGGIALQQAEVQPTGLQYDRRWMLTDKEGNFLTQRTYPKMALLQVTLVPEGLLVSHKQQLLSPFTIPYYNSGQNELTVKIWDDVCTAVHVSDEADKWFSKALQLEAQLVYMPDAARRFVETNYAHENEIVSFADAYPFLIIAQSSLDDLNHRLEQPVPMNRFRPNFVITGDIPYCEDLLQAFTISGITFFGVKLCARCVLTTVDQDLATKGKEPLKTLSAYRTQRNKVMFGQNLLHKGAGIVKTGDPLTAIRWKEE